MVVLAREMVLAGYAATTTKQDIGAAAPATGA
jgi:hypothetical protein